MYAHRIQRVAVEGVLVVEQEVGGVRKSLLQNCLLRSIRKAEVCSDLRLDERLPYNKTASNLDEGDASY